MLDSLYDLRWDLSLPVCKETENNDKAAKKKEMGGVIHNFAFVFCLLFF